MRTESLFNTRIYNPEFRNRALKAQNAYGDGNTSAKIVNIIHEWLTGQKLDIKKNL